MKDALNVPRPVTPGGPPVLVGGSGEKKTLRIVAQYADACNVFGWPASRTPPAHGRAGRPLPTVGAIRPKCGGPAWTTSSAAAWRRREACGATLRRSKLTDLPEDTQANLRRMLLIGDEAAILESVQAYLDAGLDGMIFNLPDSHDLEPVEMAGAMLSKVLLRRCSRPPAGDRPRPRPRPARRRDGVAVVRQLGLEPSDLLDLSASLNPLAPDVVTIVRTLDDGYSQLP